MADRVVFSVWRGDTWCELSMQVCMEEFLCFQNHLGRRSIQFAYAVVNRMA